MDNKPLRKKSGNRLNKYSTMEKKYWTKFTFLTRAYAYYLLKYSKILILRYHKR